MREVFVGLGLQVIRLVSSMITSYNGQAFCIFLKASIFIYFCRVCCKDTSYLFITMTVERSRKLLALLDSFDSSVLQDKFSLTR